MPRRVPPLAAAMVLVAAALVATVWTTRSAVLGAFTAVGDGQAYALQGAVRADLAELGELPTDDALAAIVRGHEPEGLRYVAIVDGRGRVIAAGGTSLGDEVGTDDAGGRFRALAGARTTRAVEHVGGRVRIAIRLPGRRAWAKGVALVLESVPEQASELRAAATRTLAIGALAALILLAVAGWLVRNELRRRAAERERERERRLASLGEMSAVLAHEIRNPLASLKGNAQLLASSLPQGDKAHAKAARVVDEAVRLEKLTQDLLAFVRTGELSRVAVSPAQLVRDAGSGIDVDDRAAPATWSLDPARMREVIVNLVENANAAGPPVRARVAGQGGRLIIEVSDGGPGVRPEDRERIFEPFFTGKTRGTGLGLAVAKRIVELHHGTIRVDDASGGGARFRIEIPEA